MAKRAFIVVNDVEHDAKVAVPIDSIYDVGGGEGLTMIRYGEGCEIICRESIDEVMGLIAKAGE